MQLVAPDVRFHRSFLEAADEFLAAGEEHYAHIVSLAADDGFEGIELTREGLEDPAEFARLVAFSGSRSDPFAPRPRSWVPYTERWMADGDTYLGRITLRHELNELLFTWGGHVGYAVRPTARGHGHAAEAVRQLFPLCAARDIDPVLITCDEDNHASRRTIERLGGVYEDSREGKRRYWVPVG